jgi:divalent metal cation (Fe/Co/Zn/Cd) transporter
MKVAKARKSSILASNAVHHRVDSLTSIVALVAICGSHLFQGASWLDPVGGLIVSMMVIQAGFGNTRQAIHELVDYSIDDDVKDAVRRSASKAVAENTDVEIRDVQGIKAGQNYLVDVQLAIPSYWTLEQIQRVEDAVRSRIGSKVRGVRRVRVKFVAKEREHANLFDEFVAPGSRPTTAEPIEEENHMHSPSDAHDHRESKNTALAQNGLRERR